MLLTARVAIAAKHSSENNHRALHDMQLTGGQCREFSDAELKTISHLRMVLRAPVKIPVTMLVYFDKRGRKCYL